MASNFEWNGDKIQQKVESAVKMGMLVTVTACLEDSKRLVHKRTGTLMRSIKTRGVDQDKDGFFSEWGSFDVNYAFWQEVLPEAKGGKAYLRPSADRNYPELAKNIRKAM